MQILDNYYYHFYTSITLIIVYTIYKVLPYYGVYHI